MGFKIKEIETEQWFGAEFGVWAKGEETPRYTAFSPFERTKCLLYVLRHPSIWFG